MTLIDAGPEQVRHTEPTSAAPAAVARTVPLARGWVPGAGHLVGLAKGPLQFMDGLVDQGPLVRMYIGSRPVVVVNDLTLIREILVEHVEDYTRGLIFQKAEGVLGQGLTVVEGEVHHRHRRMLQPVLQRQQVRKHLLEMQEVIEARLSTWQPGVAFDANDELQELGMDVFNRALFSDRLAPEAAAMVQQATPAFMTGIVAMSFYPHPLLERVPIGVNRRFTRARVNMVTAVDEIIDRFEGSDDPDQIAFLAGVMAAKEKRTGRRMDRDQLRDEIVNLVVSGATAPGTTLTWLFHELAQHPEVETRMIDELAQLADGPLSLEDVQGLPYTSAVIKETLRLHTPTWFLSRHSLRETVLGGYRIPADTEMAFSLTMLHRRNPVFAEPEAFRPDRWLDGSLDDMPHDAYMPFGAGKHGCLGEHFVQQVMLLSVAGILRRWRLVPVSAKPVREVPMALVQAKGLRVAPHRLPARRAAS
ncbi:cytochrome P450 [Angustibacter aerolatus]